MNTESVIRAWKDPKFRSTLDAAELPANPAGSRLVEVDEDELRAVWGGQEEVAPSEGYVCSASGECNETGESCWSS